MQGRLGVHEFMVLTSGGTPIFHYSVSPTRKLDELLSGFLSAITSFATEFGEKSIQSLSFEGSELLYEQYGSDHLFIFLVESGASKRVLRAVLRELTSKFLSRYENQLKMEIPILDVFMDFEDEVVRVFEYYEGILLVVANLSDFVVPELKKKRMEVAIRSGAFLDEFHRDFGSAGNKVLNAIDGRASIYEISRTTAVGEDELRNIIEYLSIRGLLKISKMCPIIKSNDPRFDAYLDLVGLPNKDYQLLERAKLLCNGKTPMAELAERLGVVPEQLYEVLEKIGDGVEWNLVEVRELTE
ncbi:MAG: hypothetical protein ACP6KW_06085 [Candidatus Thorarchaeota archaeon]|nr:MAG: hypothetical protein DRO87_11135 [Candidatus Thorarchaeota archaeon]RLI58165.1 MAG: hypothetical protein DRP09_00035 [Candidatus Thorarchaeota archaeon]